MHRNAHVLLALVLDVCFLFLTCRIHKYMMVLVIIMAL